MAGRLEEIAMAFETEEGKNELIGNVMNRQDENKDGFLNRDEFYLGNDPTKEDDDIQRNINEEL